MSFIFDTKLLFKTFIKVLKRKGISYNSVVTMEPFQGTSKGDGVVG